MAWFNGVPDEAWNLKPVIEYRSRQHKIESAISSAVRGVKWEGSKREVYKLAGTMIEYFSELEEIASVEAIEGITGHKMRLYAEDSMMDGTILAMNSHNTFFTDDGVDTVVLERFIKDAAHHTQRLALRGAMYVSEDKIFSYKRAEYMIIPSADACEFCLMCSSQIILSPSWVGHDHCHCKILPIIL